MRKILIGLALTAVAVFVYDRYLLPKNTIRGGRNSSPGAPTSPNGLNRGGITNALNRTGPTNNLYRTGNTNSVQRSGGFSNISGKLYQETVSR